MSSYFLNFIGLTMKMIREKKYVSSILLQMDFQEIEQELMPLNYLSLAQCSFFSVDDQHRHNQKINLRNQRTGIGFPEIYLLNNLASRETPSPRAAT